MAVNITSSSPLHNTLFTKQSWHSWSNAHLTSALAVIEKMAGGELLKASVEGLVELLVEEWHIKIANIRQHEISTDHDEVQIYDLGLDRHQNITTVVRAGTKIEVTLPYDGDGTCFSVSPKQLARPAVLGDVFARKVVLTYKGVQLAEAEVKAYFASTIDTIKENLKRQSIDADAFNAELSIKLREQIEQRREKLLKDRNLAASLGFPLMRRSVDGLTYVAPEVRRIIRPRTVTGSPAQSEPVLDVADYEHILGVMHSMAVFMERSPATFYDMGEDAIRDLCLLLLNGHYEGQATGETFNRGGKTDILVRVENKNIFVGECKIWSGPKGLTAGIDQLLNYLCWRDTKAAIVLFNKNAGFNEVLSQIGPTMMAHGNFVRTVEQRGETRSSYVFQHKEDSSREITITVLVFNVPRLK